MGRDAQKEKTSDSMYELVPMLSLITSASVWYKLGKIERLSIRTCTGTCSRTLHVSVHVQQLMVVCGFISTTCACTCVRIKKGFIPIIPTCTYFATHLLIGQYLWVSSNNWICSIVTWLHEMDDNLLLLSSAEDGDDYLLFTANKLKEKRIFLANFSLENLTDSQCKTMLRFL